MGKCWNCLLGHLGPGTYIILCGVLFYLYGFRAKFMDQATLGRSLFGITLVFGVTALVAESSFTWPPQMANLHHLSLYFLLLVAAFLHYFCRVKQILPMELTIAYECLLFPAAGFIFTSHNHGNAMFNGFHQVMFPGLVFAGLLHYACETAPNATTVHILRGMWFGVLGTWFSHIGVGYFLYGDSGTLGKPEDEMISAHAWGMLGNVMACHIMAWALVGFVFLSALTYFGWTNLTVAERQGYKAIHSMEQQRMLGNTDDAENGRIELASAY